MADHSTFSETGVEGRHIVVLNWRDRAHPQAGGAEVYCHKVAEQLVAMGAQVTYLTSRVGGAPPQEIINGVRVRRAGGTLTVYLHALRWLLRHRRNIEGILDSQNGIPFFSPIAARRIPVILLMHHVHREQFRMHYRRPMSDVGRLLEGPVSRVAYGFRPVAAVSPSTRHDTRRHLKLSGPIYVVPNGVAGEIVPRSRESQRSDSPLVVTVGRLVTHKRHHLSLLAFKEALGRHPTAELHMVGEGPERGALEAQARSLGLTGSVTFHGKVTDQEMASLMTRAWCAITASAGEGWGLTVVEANMFGLPVVGLDVPGIRDSVQDGATGWLAADPAQLGSVLSDALSVLESPLVAREWRTRATEWARQFSWEASACAIAALLGAERSRLTRRGRERRRRTDLATLVELPHEPPAAVIRRWRRTDTWKNAEGRFTALFYGADEQDVRTILQRSGLPLDGASLRVARPVELLLTRSHRAAA